MSAGDGYKYPLRSIAAVAGDRSLPTLLTRYHTEEGTLWGGTSKCVCFGLILGFLVY